MKYLTITVSDEQYSLLMEQGHAKGFSVVEYVERLVELYSLPTLERLTDLEDHVRILAAIVFPKALGSEPDEEALKEGREFAERYGWMS